MYSLLIADDEPLIRRGIRKLIDLKNLDISEIYEAENGEEALKIFEEFSPDIALIDINMPKLDGLSVAKKMKSISPNIKISIITGYNYFDYAQTALKIGVEDYILKPVSKNDVSEIIVKLVNSIKERKKDEELKKVLNQMSTQENTEISSKNDYKTSIQNIMDEFYTDSQFNLVSLADKVELSSGYLSIIFKKLFGIPFQDYLFQKRMEKAKILLLTTELKNFEIAELVGFDDVNYFITKFKKYYKISPKQYKDMVLKNENN